MRTEARGQYVISRNSTQNVSSAEGMCMRALYFQILVQIMTKWHIQRHDSGHYTINFDDLPIYFEQMALLVARERDQGYEWIIEPGTGKNGVYK